MGFIRLRLVETSSVASLRATLAVFSSVRLCAKLAASVLQLGVPPKHEQALYERKDWTSPMNDFQSCVS